MEAQISTVCVSGVYSRTVSVEPGAGILTMFSLYRISNSALVRFLQNIN